MMPEEGDDLLDIMFVLAVVGLAGGVVALIAMMF